MTPDRLRELVEAYGADRSRWPIDLRADAEVALARLTQPLSWLAEARALDAELDTYPAPPVSSGLARRIAASAPDLTPFWRRARAWWTGLGLASAAAAGLAVGAAAVVVASPPRPASTSDYVYDQTAFGDLAGQEG